VKRGEVLTGPVDAGSADRVDFGPYRIGELIGRGGMGTVHRAYDAANRRWVALKRLPGGGVDAEFRARFRREARIAGGLRHPHVVPVHAFGEIDGQLYLDMALIDGVDLRRLLGRGALAPQRTIALLAQIADALDTAHAAALVHRDIKPSNILIGPDDHAYLADFGIARSMSSDSTGLTRSGALLGTWDYLAPERLSGGPVDGRADQYALACVLFECLTGRLPHPAVEPAAKLAAHLLRPAPAPSVLDPTLPPALDPVVVRGMAKDPGRRFPSCGGMLEAAGSAVRGPLGPPAAGHCIGPRRRSGPGLPDPRDRPGHDRAGTVSARCAGAVPVSGAARLRGRRRPLVPRAGPGGGRSAGPADRAARRRGTGGAGRRLRFREVVGAASRADARAGGSGGGSGSLAARAVYTGGGSGRGVGVGAGPGGRGGAGGAGARDPPLAFRVRPVVHWAPPSCARPSWLRPGTPGWRSSRGWSSG
jgi:hypothetical protein